MKLRMLPFLLFLLVPYAHAGVTEQLEYANYPAKADGGGSLLHILDSASSLRAGGKIVHGYTDWQVKWTFHSMMKSGQCRITQVEVALTGKIILPQLIGGNAALRGQFDTYLSALRTHELGHYQHGKDAAADIERKIRDLPDMSSCSALQDAANTVGDSEVDFYSGKDKEYDQETQYGKTQGAWLAE